MGYSTEADKKSEGESSSITGGTGLPDKNIKFSYYASIFQICVDKSKRQFIV